ncbi:hypothetical protein D3C72_1823360 [compost metagenome]
MVANLDPCPVADRNRPWPVLAGPGIADQPQRPTGQSAGGALDQPGGAASGIARDFVIAGAPRRRVVTVAGGRFDRLAVHRAGTGRRQGARVAARGHPVVGLGPRHSGCLSVVAAARRAPASARVAFAAAPGFSTAAAAARRHCRGLATGCGPRVGDHGAYSPSHAAV